MIFNAPPQTQTQISSHHVQVRPRAQSHIFTHSRNDRTAGGMPTWRPAETQIETIMSDFVHVQNGDKAENALSYRSHGKPQNTGAYTFGDLVDIVNPLHHIPLVNLAYRGITGDTIRSSGNVIGGAVYGGAVGLANGLVNVIVAEETGKDIVGNAVSVLRDGESVVWKQKTVRSDVASAQSIDTWQNPQDLPASLLAFTEKPMSQTGSNVQTPKPRYNA